MNDLMTRTTHIIAAEINSIKEQTRIMVLYNSIEIGRRLTEAKLMVAHGEWGLWLKDSVDYSQSTANNLMKIFEQYGDDQLSLFGDNAKSQALGNLSYTQAVALLGVPEDEREQFVEENDLENMSTRELQQVIKEKQLLEQQLRESEEKEEKERLERQKISDSYTELEKKSKAHDELVERLNTELEEAKATGNNDEAWKLQESLEKSKNQLLESRSRIKELETQLKQKPIEVTAMVEKIPEEIEIEIAELRKSQQKNKSVIKFTYCFDSLVNGFKDLLSSLSEIKETDPEEHEKYKNAVTGLIGKMSEKL